MAARLISTLIMSLDGFIEDETGGFAWAEPSEEVHSFVNDLERSTGTYLYGRRMYETMVWWEDDANTADEPAVVQDYAQIWRAADKVVHSTTMTSVSSERTRVKRDFDVGGVRALKADAPSDLGIGGPGLTETAWDAGLVDLLRLFVVPVVVGTGKRALPRSLQRLELVEERRFGNGTLFLEYAVQH